MASMKDVVRLYQLEQQITVAKKHGNYSKALQMYNEIIQIKQNISSALGVAKSYAEQGELLAECGDRKGAIVLYQQAALIAERSKNPEFLSVINYQIEKLHSFEN